MGKFKTSIGGQAVMGGISMKGPELTCLALRMPDGTIKKEITKSEKNPVSKIPVARGVAAIIIAFKNGYEQLMKSADAIVADVEEDAFDRMLKKVFGEKSDNVIEYVAAALAACLSVGLFVVLPTVITGLISLVIPLGVFKALIEGIIKICIFLGYIYLSSRMKEIQEVFKYHGAEHKTIFCYEDGAELTVENVRKYGRFHPRCGTSYMFIVILISILVFTFVPWTSTWLRVVYKILSLPLIMGVSYECLKYAGKHDNKLAVIMRTPGLLVQRLTVFEPDDDMIEVAIAAMKEVIPENPEEASI